MNLIGDHFHELEKEQLQVECSKMKYDMHSWRQTLLIPETSELATVWCLKKVQEMSSFYPALNVITEVFLATPVSNAWPERGASALKRIKTRLQSSLQSEMMQTLMHISINGPDLSLEKCTALIKDAAKIWLG